MLERRTPSVANELGATNLLQHVDVHKAEARAALGKAVAGLLEDRDLSSVAKEHVRRG